MRTHPGMPTPQVEAAAARYVAAVVARYGAAGALSRTRMLVHERAFRYRKPQWLTRAIEMLEQATTQRGEQ